MTHLSPDVLIIGGGINGISIARELAFRGVSVCVVEQSDLCSGASSASSKLLHGGIRYLEHGNLALVADACRERYFWVRNAPHIVSIQPFYIPVYARDIRKPWMVRIGLALYEWLSLGRRIGHNRMIDIDQAIRIEPSLNTTDLVGVAEYFDGKMDDSRLGIECAMQARSLGASFLTYSQVTAIDLHRKLVTVSSGSVERIITPKVILNTTGPWANLIAGRVHPSGGPIVQPTKGVHITTKPIVSSHALLISAQSDNRVIFVIPHDSYSLIGTTDTLYTGDPSHVQPTAEDIRYLINEVRRVSTVPLGVTDIYSAYAGLRPLAASQADSPAKMSRDHRLVAHGDQFYSMVGGKYTTCRSMAEEAAKVILSELRMPWFGSTKDLPLPPTVSFESTPVELRDEWISTVVQDQFVSTLDDVMRRRSQLFFTKGNGDDVAESIAARLAEALGRDSDWMDDQVATYRQKIAAMRSVIEAAF